MYWNWLLFCQSLRWKRFWPPKFGSFWTIKEIKNLHFAKFCRYCGTKKKCNEIKFCMFVCVQGRLMAHQVFDTYMDKMADALVLFLNTITSGRIICMAIKVRWCTYYVWISVFLENVLSDSFSYSWFVNWWLSMNERGGRCSILTRRWSRASYNVTDAGIVSQLWVSRLRADHQAFIEPKDQNSGVKLGKGTGRARVRHRTVYGHLAPGGGGGGGTAFCEKLA